MSLLLLLLSMERNWGSILNFNCLMVMKVLHFIRRVVLKSMVLFVFSACLPLNRNAAVFLIIWVMENFLCMLSQTICVKFSMHWQVSMLLCKVYIRLPFSNFIYNTFATLDIESSQACVFSGNCIFQTKNLIADKQISWIY